MTTHHAQMQMGTFTMCRKLFNFFHRLEIFVAKEYEMMMMKTRTFIICDEGWFDRQDTARFEHLDPIEPGTWHLAPGTFGIVTTWHR